MAKLDLKAAYRMVPVHPADSPLLGIRWRESTLIDRALPFGLRSAPIIFSAVADALAWAMHCEGVQYTIHYLDDFFCGPANSTSCAKDVNIAIPLCNHLGLPVAPEKVEGPVIAITFLGIEINSATMTLSLPQDKLTALKARLASWVGKRRASKHQLQELLGHLNHAAAVVRPGKSFLRCIIEAMKRPRLPSQFTRINTQCRADILWWSIFVSSWNGVSLLPPAIPNITIISDASGSWECEAFNQYTGEWFQISWPTTWKDINIAVKELLPITIAAAIWGNQWKDQRILILSDNAAVVATLKARSARHVTLSHLIKCLFFWEATFDFEHNSEHIAGSLNTTADALSRNRLDLIFSLNPQAKAAATSTPIPNPVLAVLLDSNLQWTSPCWERLFRSCLNRV